MNCDTGEIISKRVYEQLAESDQSRYSFQVDPENLGARQQAQLRTTGRTRAFKNSKCPCGNGKRFKNCHSAKQKD